MGDQEGRGGHQGVGKGVLSGRSRPASADREGDGIGAGDDREAKGGDGGEAGGVSREQSAPGFSDIIAVPVVFGLHGGKACHAESPKPTLNGTIHPIGEIFRQFTPSIDAIFDFLVGWLRQIIDSSAVLGIFKPSQTSLEQSLGLDFRWR